MQTAAVPRSPVEAAYLAQQLSFAVPAAVSQRMLRLALGRGVRPRSEDLAALDRRLWGLYARDMQNVRDGLYPRMIEDSAQRADSPKMMFFLERFPEDFHEPFYADYLGDDLKVAAEEVGFQDVSAEPIFVAKVVSARKPG